MAPLAPGKKHTATLRGGDPKWQMLICFLICPPIGPFCFPVLVLLCKLHVYFSSVPLHSILLARGSKDLRVLTLSDVSSLRIILPFRSCQCHAVM